MTMNSQLSLEVNEDMRQLRDGGKVAELTDWRWD